MSIFRCDKCGCVENTAVSHYWLRDVGEDNKFIGPALCSECDPQIGKWHGRFDKHSAVGLVLASDGFLYDPEDVESHSFRWRMEHQGLQVVKIIEA